MQMFNFFMGTLSMDGLNKQLRGPAIIKTNGQNPPDKKYVLDASSFLVT